MINFVIAFIAAVILTALMVIFGYIIFHVFMVVYKIRAMKRISQLSEEVCRKSPGITLTASLILPSAILTILLMVVIILLLR